MKYLAQAELKKLFHAIEESQGENQCWFRDLVIFNVAYLCGLRVSEVGLLRLRDFHQGEGELFCHRLKGSISNTIRLDQPRISLLGRYIKECRISDPDQALFRSQRGRPISSRRLDTLVKEYAAKAGIARHLAHFHALKHSIGVHLAESGADIKELQSYLGHKNVQNTMIYTQFTTRQMDVFYKKIRKNSQIVV